MLQSLLPQTTLTDGVLAGTTTFPGGILTSAGNVGIGTTTLLHRFTVVGGSADLFPALIVGNNVDTRIRLENDTAVSTSNTAGLDLAVMSSVQPRSAALIQALLTDTSDATRTGDLLFRTARNSLIIEAMRITGAGKVGIGNAIPAVDLDVGATASALRVRNLFPDAGNGEWFGISWSGNVVTVGTGANGTGVVRAVTATGAWAFAGPIKATGAEDSQFQLALGGQQWNLNMASGSSFYLHDASFGKFPFVVQANGDLTYTLGTAAHAFVGAATFSSTVTAASITTSATDFIHKTSGTLANGAGAQSATMTNGPTAGNPTKWIPISDNGTTRYIPAW